MIWKKKDYYSDDYRNNKEYFIIGLIALLIRWTFIIVLVYLFFNTRKIQVLITPWTENKEVQHVPKDH